MMLVTRKDLNKSALVDYVPNIIDVHGDLATQWAEQKCVKSEDLNRCNLTVFCEICGMLANAMNNDLAVVPPQDLQETINPVNPVPASFEDKLLIYRTRLKIRNTANISIGEVGGILKKLRDKLALMEYHEEFENLTDDFWGLDSVDFVIVGISICDSHINIDWGLAKEYYISIK